MASGYTEDEEGLCTRLASREDLGLEVPVRAENPWHKESKSRCK